jgi:hypothetical protein
MKHFFWLGALGAAALAACAPASGPAKSPPGGCAEAVARATIGFTAPDAKDLVEARALGPTCESAAVVWTLRAADGALLHVQAAPYVHIAQPKNAGDRAELQAFLDRWVGVSVDDTGQSPAWPAGAELLPEEAGAGAGSPLLRESYEAVRSAKLARLCLTTAHESFSCLFYDPDAKVAGEHFFGGD